MSKEVGEEEEGLDHPSPTADRATPPPGEVKVSISIFESVCCCAVTFNISMFLESVFPVPH